MSFECCEACRLRACFYDLPIDKEWGIPQKTTPELVDVKGVKAVIVTSPSYEGIISDVEKLRRFVEITVLI